MPDEQGRLLPEEMERIKSKLLSTDGANWQCPACGHNKWSFGSSVVSLISATALSAGKGYVFYDALTVICDNCGYMRLHHPPRILPEAYNEEGEDV